MDVLKIWPFLLLLLLSCSEAHATLAGTTIYRIIQTNRLDFIYALTARSNLTPVANTGSSTRLNRYFTITKKEVSGNTITMKIRPQARFLPVDFSKYSAFQIRLTQLPSNIDPVYQVQFQLSEHATIDCLMTVMEYQAQETQLKLDIQRTTLPEWMMKAALDLIVRMNLAGRESGSSSK